MGGTFAVKVIDPIGKDGSIKVYDTQEDKYRTERSAVSNIVLGILQTLLAFYYYKAYREQLDEYKSILNRMTDIIEYKHRWYVDKYDKNRDRVHTFLNALPQYSIDYSSVVGAMAFADGRLNVFSSCSKSLQEFINTGDRQNNPSNRIKSALVSTKAHMYQRRVRDVEALEYAYDIERMNNKNKANRFGSQEFTNSMQYFQNAANHRQTLMQMASSSFSGNMTGALYHLDHLTNGRTQAKTTFDNSSQSNSNSAPIYNKGTEYQGDWHQTRERQD